jgi:hypothetical protein
MNFLNNQFKNSKIFQNTNKNHKNHMSYNKNVPSSIKNTHLDQDCLIGRVRGQRRR